MMLLHAVYVYISTDLSPIPLFWLVPVTLYVASWFIAIPALLFFRTVTLPVHRWLLLVEAVLIGAAVFFRCLASALDVYALVVLQFGVLFVVGLVCHGELLKDCSLSVRSVPVTSCAMVGILAGYYFMAALPVWSTGPTLDLSIVLVLASLVRPVAPFRALWSRSAEPVQGWRSHALDIVAPAGLGALTVLTLWLSGFWGEERRPEWLSPALLFGVATGVCLLLCARPLRFGLAIAIVLLLHAVWIQPQENEELHRDRSYFGAVRAAEVQPATKPQRITKVDVEGWPPLEDAFKTQYIERKNGVITNLPETFAKNFSWFPNPNLDASQSAALVGYGAASGPLPLLGAWALRLRR